MPCVCGRTHPKVRVNLAAYGLWRVDNHRDVVRSRSSAAGASGEGQGFAAPNGGWGYDMLLIDAFDEHVYDVTEWAVCRFKLRRYELENIQFTAASRGGCGSRRRSGRGGAPPPRCVGGRRTARAEENWAEEVTRAPPPPRRDPGPPAPKQRQKKPGTGKKGKRRR